MKRILLTLLCAAACALATPSEAAEPAVYYPQLDGDAVFSDVGYRANVRRFQRQTQRSFRQFDRDVRGFQRDVRRFDRQLDRRFRGPVYRGSSFRYSSPGYYYGPRNGVHFGNVGIYW